MPTFKHPCPHCGKWIERDVRACPYCGVADPFAPGRCPQCRAVIEDLTWITCPKCGASLTAEAPGGAV
jgi:RNA polymerase subunit RPABC4/transcription elongation factor Spt4